jgi:hypothetical protein
MPADGWSESGGGCDGGTSLLRDDRRWDKPSEAVQGVDLSSVVVRSRGLGFFGLGVGYLIYGPQELVGYPPRDRQVDRANGVWGLWMAGFCQFLVGVYLFVGLSWFPVFTGNKALYMAALAFSAYGIHWFAMGWNRAQGADA